jgi:ATP-dependent Clp protease ATP-binding subunit ClpC
MFERFTDRARRVVVLAQEEARRLDHNYIGTEHILLGLLRDGEGVAVEALDGLGISLEETRAKVGEIIGRGSDQPSGHIPFTPRAKKVLELSLREALELGTDYIGTEHILLGLIREGQGVAAQVLVDLGAGLEQTREKVLELIRGGGAEGEPAGELEARLTRMGPEVRVVGSPAQVSEIIARLRSIDGRLAAVERHLGIGKADPEAG